MNKEATSQQNLDYIKEELLRLSQTVFELAVNHLALSDALIKKGLITEEEINKQLEASLNEVIMKMVTPSSDTSH